MWRGREALGPLLLLSILQALIEGLFLLPLPPLRMHNGAGVRWRRSGWATAVWELHRGWWV